MDHIRLIDYRIDNILFPYKFAVGHLAAAYDHGVAAKRTGEWLGHTVVIIVHAAFMVLELIPLVNLVVALADKYFCEECFGRPSGLRRPPAPLQQQNRQQQNRLQLGAPLRQLPQRRPAAPQPIPEGVAQISQYLVNLGIIAPEQYSERLQCQIDKFALRGLRSVEDLKTLGLTLLSDPIQRLRAAYPQWQAQLAEALHSDCDENNPESGAVDAVLRQIFQEVEALNQAMNEICAVDSLEKAQAWVPMRQDLQAIWQKGLCLTLTVPRLSLEDALSRLKESNKKDRAQSRKLRNDVIDLLAPLKESFNRVSAVVREANSHPEAIAILNTLAERFALIDKDLANDKLDYTAALGAIEELPALFEQLDAQFPCVEGSLESIEAADSERQVRWLKAYLLQTDVLAFWRSRPLNDSLTLFCIAKQHSLADLFNLAVYVPLAAPKQNEALLAPVADPDADAQLAALLEAGAFDD